MFVKFRRRRLGLSPSKRVGCTHRGPGRQSLRPYLCRNFRHPVTDTPTKEYMVPLAGTVGTCCLAKDLRRRCRFWLEVDGHLAELLDSARRGLLDQRFAALDHDLYDALRCSVARVVAYPSPAEWAYFSELCRRRRHGRP